MQTRDSRYNGIHDKAYVGIHTRDAYATGRRDERRNDPELPGPNNCALKQASLFTMTIVLRPRRPGARFAPNGIKKPATLGTCTATQALGESA